MMRLCPEAIVYTEFLSTDAIHYGAKKTMEMLSYNAELERPFIVQVFGHDPQHFLSAAKVVEELGADGLDINMGCPAAKVVSSCHGAALLKNVDLAAELVYAAKKTVSIPVSVKTRLGWSDINDLIPFCTRLVEAGADALAIHGRRFCDKFTGQAHWGPIYKLKEALPNIPIIGNGDIKTPADAVAKIGNLDGVMVGRGTFGNPWLIREVSDALRVRCSLNRSSLLVETDERKTKNEETKNDYPMRPVPMTFQDKIPYILEHCELAVKIKGEKRGMLEMRRHLSSYVKGFPGAAELRMKLVVVEKLEEAQRLLQAV